MRKIRLGKVSTWMLSSLLNNQLMTLIILYMYFSTEVTCDQAGICGIVNYNCDYKHQVCALQFWVNVLVCV